MVDAAARRDGGAGAGGGQAARPARAARRAPRPGRAAAATPVTVPRAGRLVVDRAAALGRQHAVVRLAGRLAARRLRPTRPPAGRPPARPSWSWSGGWRAAAGGGPSGPAFTRLADLVLSRSGPGRGLAAAAARLAGGSEVTARPTVRRPAGRPRRRPGRRAGAARRRHADRAAAGRARRSPSRPPPRRRLLTRTPAFRLAGAPVTTSAVRRELGVVRPRRGRPLATRGAARRAARPRPWRRSGRSRVQRGAAVRWRGFVQRWAGRRELPPSARPARPWPGSGPTGSVPTGCTSSRPPRRPQRADRRGACSGLPLRPGAAAAGAGPLAGPVARRRRRGPPGQRGARGAGGRATRGTRWSAAWSTLGRRALRVARPVRRPDRARGAPRLVRSTAPSR